MSNVPSSGPVHPDTWRCRVVSGGQGARPGGSRARTPASSRHSRAAASSTSSSSSHPPLGMVQPGFDEEEIRSRRPSQERSGTQLRAEVGWAAGAPLRHHHGLRTRPPGAHHHPTAAWHGRRVSWGRARQASTAVGNWWSVLRPMSDAGPAKKVVTVDFSTFNDRNVPNRVRGSGQNGRECPVGAREAPVTDGSSAAACEAAQTWERTARREGSRRRVQEGVLRCDRLWCALLGRAWGMRGEAELRLSPRRCPGPAQEVSQAGAG